MKAVLPAHYWIVVLDIENFSTRSDPVQVRLRKSMHEVVQEAVAGAHLEWDELGIKDEGDGLILFFPAHVPPVRIVGDFLRELNAGLTEIRGYASPETQFRLRVSLHHGMATEDASGWPGNATNVACRLVDVDLLREVLTSVGDASLAVIVSDEFYRTVVQPGHRSIDPSTYTSVVVDLKKAPGSKAWIHVPGYVTPPGLPLQDVAVLSLEDQFMLGGFDRAADARQSLLHDLRRRTERSGDTNLLFALEVLEAELDRPDPNPRTVSRALAMLRRSMPLIVKDPRLSTGFDGICELPGDG